MFDIWKNRKSETEKDPKVVYVAKYGFNEKVCKRFACNSLTQINKYNFENNCHIIEIYRQTADTKINRNDTQINENALMLMARLFKGDFIPTLYALQLPCEKTSVNIKYKDEYNKIVKNLVNKDAAGIISVDGYPYIAHVNNTFYIDSLENGKVKSVCSLDSLYISAEMKYKAILEGKDYISPTNQINSRNKIPIKDLSDVLKK